MRGVDIVWKISTLRYGFDCLIANVSMFAIVILGNWTTSHAECSLWPARTDGGTNKSLLSSVLSVHKRIENVSHGPCGPAPIWTVQSTTGPLRTPTWTVHSIIDLVTAPMWTVWSRKDLITVMDRTDHYWAVLYNSYMDCMVHNIFKVQCAGREERLYITLCMAKCTNYKGLSPDSLWSLHRPCGRSRRKTCRTAKSALPQGSQGLSKRQFEPMHEDERAGNKLQIARLGTNMDFEFNISSTEFRCWGCGATELCISACMENIASWRL